MSLFPNHPPHGFLKARQSRSRVEKLHVPLFSLIQSCPCLSCPFFFFFFLLFSYCCFQGNHTNVGTHDSAKQVGGLREQREKKAERVQKEKLGQKKWIENRRDNKNNLFLQRDSQFYPLLIIGNDSGQDKCDDESVEIKENRRNGNEKKRRRKKEDEWIYIHIIQGGMSVS